MPGLNRIINYSSNYKSVIPSIERIYTEFHSKPYKQKYDNNKDFEFTHSIIIKGLSYKYLNADRNVLEKVNLTINKGDFVGIVGETGSGKSTLVDLILGYCHLTHIFLSMTSFR